MITAHRRGSWAFIRSVLGPEALPAVSVLMPAPLDPYPIVPTNQIAGWEGRLFFSHTLAPLWPVWLCLAAADGRCVEDAGCRGGGDGGALAVCAAQGAGSVRAMAIADEVRPRGVGTCMSWLFCSVVWSLEV